MKKIDERTLVEVDACMNIPRPLHQTKIAFVRPVTTDERTRACARARERKINLEEEGKMISLVQLFPSLSKHHSTPQAKKYINHSCFNVIGMGNSLIVHCDPFDILSSSG